MINKPTRKAAGRDIFQLLLYVLVPLLWLILYFIVKVPTPLWYLIFLQAAISFYFIISRPRLFIPGLFFAILLLTTYLPLPIGLWLINILISVAAVSLLTLLIRPLRRIFPRLPTGHLDVSIIGYMILVIIISSAALIIWKAVFHPDFSSLERIAEAVSKDLLLPSIIGFSIFNAVAEELMFRWIMWDGLTELTTSMILVIAIQALVFGLSHYPGFPNGWLGVGMAFCYGLMLGFIRFRAGGLMAPVLTHVFADLTIIIIVFSSAGMI